MSGRPYTYSRGMAIAQLMRDMRRPIIKKLAEEKYGLPTVYLYKDELYTAYSDTIDWVPKLQKLTKYGRHAPYLTEAQIAIETPDQKQFPTYWSDILKRQLYIESIEGWPTEEEIAAEIAASAEREKQGGGLAVNDITAMQRLLG